MKKLLLLTVIVLCCRFVTIAQITSLTVDCQTPGWLASYINPSDVPYIQNLKVTGIINSNDLITIGNLVKNYNLHGRLDLGDVLIEGNELNGEMFGVEECQLSYFALPKDIQKLTRCIDWVTLDTLVACSEKYPRFDHRRGNYANILETYTAKDKFLNVKHIILREGTISIEIRDYINNQNNNTFIESIYFPQSMKRIEEVSFLAVLKEMNIPENVEMLGNLTGSSYYINGDTLIVPSSVNNFNDLWAAPDGYKGGQGYDASGYHEGRISCVYLPDIDTLYCHGNQSHPMGFRYGAQNTVIHIRSKHEPYTGGGGEPLNATIYVPKGCSNAYSNWAQYNTIIEEDAYVESVSLDKHELSLNVGANEQLLANVLPNTANNKRLLWSSTNTEIASVDESGTVTGKKAGSTFIKVVSEDNPNAMDSCKVTVLQPVTGITLDKSSIELHNIGETAQIIARIIPADASNQEVNWTSSQQSVCYVSNGTVVAVGYGTSVVIATTVDGGYVAVCTVNVTENPNLMLGDINGDNIVDVEDVNAAINIILRLNSISDYLGNADVTNDGVVDIEDVNAIINIILKL